MMPINNDAISRRNMLETISYVKRRVIDCRNEGRLTERQSENVICVADLFAELISDAPALDVEPVIHATWIEDGYYEKPCVCSHCGEEAHYTSTFREQFEYDWDENLVPCGYEEIREYVRDKRCHECGARMDGEAE